MTGASLATWVAGLDADLPADRDPARRDQLGGLLPGPGQPPPDQLRVQPARTRHAAGHQGAAPPGARLAGRPGLGRAGQAAGAGLPGVAELAEDLAQPAVDFLRTAGRSARSSVLERGQPLDGRVDPGVTGGGRSRPLPF